MSNMKGYLFIFFSCFFNVHCECPMAFDIPENCQCDGVTFKVYCLINDCGDIAHNLFVAVKNLIVFGPVCEADFNALSVLYRDELVLTDAQCHGLPKCVRYVKFCICFFFLFYILKKSRKKRSCE